jgi:hypothetical protein
LRRRSLDACKVATVVDEDPTTEELKLEQRQREESERDAAGSAHGDEETEQHERRADKAGYLREKLEERAESERRAEEEDG